MLEFLKSKPDASLPPLRFHNTLSNELEDFSPINGEVKMYNCGPTVYGTQHIGNMRAAVFADTIRRALVAWDYPVKQVINITDFGHLTSDADEGDDKMTVGLKASGMEPTLENMRTLATKYMYEYFDDIEQLGLPLKKIQFPRASDYVGEQIQLIKTLEEKGYAYQTSSGVYYDVSRFGDYGKLGNINLSGLKEGARVQENSEKKGPLDFILWKSDSKLGWESPWGLGFPGWHIECTAMIFKLLGKQIDIHTGGIEHIPVHHNNEIAQAEAASGKHPFVKYWLHNDHITIEGKKISKSLGNTVYLHNIVDKGLSSRSLRYWFLTAHYRSGANFTWDAVGAADTALARLNRTYLEMTADKIEPTSDAEFENEFYSAIGDDLDTPRAIASLWDYLKTDASSGQKYAALTLADNVLGLGLSQARETAKLVVKHGDLPEEIQALVTEREIARKEKDFQKADDLRAELEKKGYDIKDTPEGPEITQK